MDVQGKPSAEQTPKNEDSLKGFLFALTAYVLWGFLPLYMKSLSHIPPAEVIGHRVIWSLPIALGVILFMGRSADLRLAFKNPKTLSMAALTAALISINWGTYVWAIGANHAIDAALGYYINPLFSVFLARILLGEELSRAQWVAVSLAAIAVVILTYETGRLPVVALILTFTWGIYAYLKKSLPIGPNQGFTLEVMLLSPFFGLYLLWLEYNGQGHFISGSMSDLLLLIGCGAVTAIPLMVYANGAKKLRLTTIAMMQYIAPTMIFLTAVFVFKEPFGSARAIAFPLIWLALIIFTFSLIKSRRRT